VKLTDGPAREFWVALGVLLAIRLFFSIIEALGGILSWRVYGKKVMIERNLKLLRANHFPKREYAHDDFAGYLARIEQGPKYSEQLKAVAQQMYFVLSFFESAGMLSGMRMHAAADEALNIYSPTIPASHATTL
jgi:hypothetical protein